MKSKKIKEPSLPKGFTAVEVSGEFAAWHDFKKNPVLTGKVTQRGSFDQKDGKKTRKRQVLTVLQASGVSASFSDSFALSGLFSDKKIVGKEIYVRFLGQEKIKGGKKLNRFQVASK